jgi:DnaJ-class molecular chaperone
MSIPFEVILNPDKYGYKQCDHCNGYGSSLKDPRGVDRCTKCDGVGLIKKEEK